MTKKITAVTGEYVAQDGTQKAEFTDLGVIVSGKNGKEYLMLKPEINLAGVLIKQNALALKRGEQPRDMVMTSIIERQAQGMPQQSQQPQYAPQQSPHAQNQQAQYANRQQMPRDDFDDDIGF